MLIRLPPEQIMKYWDGICECIASALPPHEIADVDMLLRIQSQLLTGVLECWIAASDNRGREIYGVMTTKIMIDGITGTRNLLIFSVTTVDKHPAGMWKEALDVINRYACTHKCSNILAYSVNERMVEIAEAIGANTQTRLIYFPVKES